MKADHRHIIDLHINTERTTRMKQENNEYVFRVAKGANKYVIKEAVEQAFKVKVAAVRTMIVPGKERRMGRNVGKTSTWKKAVVRLKKGEVITMFENV
ncbi:MAG: 50S ribosomal protein L23 [Candidatus Zixiibacteriota bacterium]